MKHAKYMNKIIAFLKANGWKEESYHKDDYYSFFHECNYGIDIEKNGNEIVVIADSGDIFHIPLSRLTLYTLIGFLHLYPANNRPIVYLYPKEEE
jgi:hypothetical protein